MIEKFIETKTIVTEKVFCDKCGEEIVYDPEDDDPPYHCIICDGDFCNNGRCNDKFRGLNYNDDICPSCRNIMKFDEAEEMLSKEYQRREGLKKQKSDAFKLIDDQFRELFTESYKISDDIRAKYIHEARKDLGKIWADG